MHSLLVAFVSACMLLAQANPGGGSIAGHVVNSLTSAPVPRATVILTAAQVRLVAASDSGGRFEFTALPAGTYRLSATRAGFLDHGAGRPISLGENEHVTAAEIRLPPQSVISGHVLDEVGEPVDRARLWIFKQVYRYGQRMWDRLNTVETGDTGAYRFGNLRPGRYLVQAFDHRAPVDNRYGTPPASFYVPAFYPSAATQQEAMPVTVGVGAEVSSINIQLFKVNRPPSVRIRGRVIGLPPNSPIIVSVGLSPTDGNFFGNASTQAMPPNYAFEMRAPPGQYVISGSVYSGGPEAYGAASIAVTGELDGVILTMRPAPDISSRIILAEGGQVNLKDVSITIAGISTFLASGEFKLQSDALGKLNSFPTAVRRPGHFSIVNMRSLPDGYFLRGVKLDGQEISPEDFEIQGSAELEFVLSNTAGMIAGTVVDAERKPVPGSTVTLISGDGRSRSAKQSVDDGGMFRFTNLRPGPYKLFAWEEVDDDLWPDPEFRKKYDDRATEVTLRANEKQNAQLLPISAEEVK